MDVFGAPQARVDGFGTLEAGMEVLLHLSPSPAQRRLPTNTMLGREENPFISTFPWFLNCFVTFAEYSQCC